MTPVLTSVIIGGVTFVLSVATSALVVGVAWGKVTQRILNMERDLSEIKGMFRLTLKE